MDTKYKLMIYGVPQQVKNLNLGLRFGETKQVTMIWCELFDETGVEIYEDDVKKIINK